MTILGEQAQLRVDHDEDVVINVDEQDMFNMYKYGEFHMHPI